MKITTNNILLVIFAVSILLVGIVSADSEYCSPTTGANVTIDIAGSWTNITVYSEDCPICIDWGFGISCFGDCALGNYTRIFGQESAVRFNQSYSLDDGTSTPWEIWLASGIIGFILFLLSLVWPLRSKQDIETDIIISVLVWGPIAFCAYASFAVDQIASWGVSSQAGMYVLIENHILQSNTVAGILMFVFLVVAIMNTIRIITIHRIFTKGEDD
jgi:hypothetical protein